MLTDLGLERRSISTPSAGARLVAGPGVKEEPSARLCGGFRAACEFPAGPCLNAAKLGGTRSPPRVFGYAALIKGILLAARHAH